MKARLERREALSTPGAKWSPQSGVRKRARRLFQGGASSAGAARSCTSGVDRRSRT